MDQQRYHPDNYEPQDPEELPRCYRTLGEEIASLPPGEHRRRLEATYAQVTDSMRRRRRILTLVQDALAQLRLDIRYLMFDLEATKKERDALQQQLHEIEAEEEEDYGDEDDEY